MKRLKRIAVFCGSSSGADTVYAQQARMLGETLAGEGIELVYGGARVGLMGAVADGVLENGGRVTGVLPAFLKDVEIAHRGLTELIITDTMHQRKALMEELADGVIMLPGGFGTLEEFFELLTWGQLGLHKKPMGLLNVQGFYDALLALTDHMTAAGFLRPENRDMILVGTAAGELLTRMQAYEATFHRKWIDNKKL